MVASALVSLLVTTSTDECFQQLEEFLQRVMGLVQTQSMDLTVELDLTLGQARTVFALACAERPMAISELAERLGLSVAAQGRTVDRLVSLGVVERREAESDRRVKLVSLTERGLELSDAHGARKRQALRDVVDQLPESLRTGLSEALAPILAGDHLRPNDKKVPA